LPLQVTEIHFVRHSSLQRHWVELQAAEPSLKKKKAATTKVFVGFRRRVRGIIMAFEINI
jgi:hypothetical protein